MLPKEYSYLWKTFRRLILGEEERKCDLPRDAAEGIGILRRDLLAAGILECCGSVPDSVPAELRSQMTFLSCFDGPEGRRLEFQDKLKQARIVVVGVGGVGCFAAVGLALAGIGKLVIIDHDVIEASNLNRQLLYRSSDVGRLKVEVARHRLVELAPSLVVDAVAKRITRPEDLRDVVKEADALLCTADFPFHYIYRWINSECVKSDVPWIQANSAEATGFIGPFVIPGKTACYGCMELAWQQGDPEYLVAIDTLNRDETNYVGKSSTLGAAIGIVGNIVALELIKHISGFSEPSTLGRQLSIDFGTLEWREEKTPHRRECPVCGFRTPATKDR